MCEAIKVDMTQSSHSWFSLPLLSTAPATRDDLELLDRVGLG